ncbi:MAG TPA: hybrid sensor histidine kinase/response regulator transcription factor [Saprospiraceae bacterium]|nr:hybrid sensor histidine kinase/response regulator transcription factor [Saprospiraceae bacterium]
MQLFIRSFSGLRIYFTFLLTLLVLSGLWAQTSQGSLFLRNYTPEEYKGHNQNWAIVQDARGVMYFGNNHGVLEYDGVSWRIIKTAEENIIRSLGISTDGTVFTGGLGEIGYLDADSINNLHYVSLLPRLDKKYHDFADVWQTLSTSKGIYFVTAKYVFRWDGKKMHTWETSTGFHVGFVINDQFYVRQKQSGLMQINGDEISLAPLGEKFAEERIMAMLPYPAKGNNTILIATRTSGLLLYDGLTLNTFTTEADPILKESLVYCGAILTGNHFAFGTLQNGVVIIDQNGKLLHHLNKAAGLQDETIWYLYPDRQGGLWIGMHVGITRAETGSQHTFFGEREGLEGSVLDIIRHNKILYAATSMGIYFLDESAVKFKRIENVSPQAWALVAFDDKLMAATFEGVFEIRGTQSKLIDSVYAMSLARSLQDPNRLYIGMQSGFKSLYRVGDKWKDEGNVSGIEQEVDFIYEYPKGNVWLTTRENEILLLDFSKTSFSTPSLTSFDTISGLPPGDRVTAFPTIKGLRFGTDRGIYQFNWQKQFFTPDTSLVKGLNFEETDIYTVTKGAMGNLWIVSDDKSGVGWLQSDSTYKWDNSPFLRIDNLDHYYAYRDPMYTDITWIGCLDRIIRYDGSIKNNLKQPYSTLIRQVSVNGDSILYGGANQRSAGNIKLTHGYKSVRFNFAAPTFDEESKTEYQYFLEGYDTQWSAWSTETYKDYTGLPRGFYKFRIRSRNIYDQEGEEASMDFKILPPWYASWWAFLIYAALFAVAMRLLWKRQLVNIETKHVQQLKEVELQKLKELDQLKSQFFADISHEFRTPLTLILGPVDNLLDQHPTEEQVKQYSLIRRNAQRLLRLINQLLDLSKLDSGKMKLDLEQADIIPLLKAITDSFESLAQSKKINLELHSKVTEAEINFDRDKFEQILSNLISNALKFTPENGNVTLEVRKNTPSHTLEIDVTDTGTGISKSQLPHVFERFYQGSQTALSGEPGTGIGLALAKELVELHKGKITVRSLEGKGTTFTVSLPFVRDNKISNGQPVRNGFKPIKAQDIPVGWDSFIENQELLSENTLLLVEDNPDMRSFIRDILTGSYNVIEAIDGQDGINKAVDLVPDIIISDVMMPQKDGLQLCEELKNDERTSHIPLILLTAKADIESRLAGLECGADDYLAKPFNRKEILLRTKNLLENRKRLWVKHIALKPTDSPVPKEIEKEDAFLKKIRSLVEENLSESAFEIEGLSQLAGMSRSQMFRKLKALTGQSPSLYIRGIRLQKAKELLEDSDLNVSEVAYQVGFSSPAYFSDAFTEMYNIRPSQLKK